MLTFCGDGIAVAGASSGVLENNIVEAIGGGNGCPTTGAALAVDSAAASAVTADYNSTFSAAPFVRYDWSGTSYPTAAAFRAATTQATHDVDATDTTISNEGAPVSIDSANADAPGELATDALGNPRVDDPIVANTGAGVTTYYDRGAYETSDQIRPPRT